MKLKVHIDSKGYLQKPTTKEIGGIKTRLQKDASPTLVTVKELAQKIRTGHSISPGIMEGMSAKDWTEQQLLSIITTEGGIFDTLAGRYSNTISIDTVLKAYSGDPIRVDRKGREGEVINNPTLTMLLSAQDNVLAEIMKNEAFKSRGLTARIFYSRPKSKMGNRSYDTPEIDTDLELAYKQLITKLLEIPYPSNSVLPSIHLSPSAKDKVKHFHDWLEPKLVDGLEHMDG